MAVKAVHLRGDLGWAPDLDRLESTVSNRTKMIVVCNPNNPTGAILSASEMEAITRIASRCGAWILADEIYQGSERDGHTTRSFHGTYDRVIVTNGLSKAYGLPGLRIGWIVAPSERIARTWSYHDYTTIAPGTISDMLARVALSPGGRMRCLERTRSICRHNFPLFRQWVEEHGSMFSLVEPRAGAIAYVHYDLPINSTDLIQRLLHEKSVLVVPGDHFGMDHYLRIGYGPPADYLQQALDQVHDLLQSLRPSAERASFKI
jgi:hypothetical protein